MQRMEGIRIMWRITSIICSNKRQLEHQGLGRRRRRQVGAHPHRHHRQGIRSREGRLEGGWTNGGWV